MWGVDLPFLVKVLSIEKALSIQAHPDKELARDFHKSQPFNQVELKNVLCTVPEIVELVEGADASRILFCEPNSPEGKAEKEELVMRLEDQYPDDAGVMAAFLLNYVNLNCGCSRNSERSLLESIHDKTATVVFPSVAGPSVFLFLAGYAIGYAGSKKYKFEEGEVVFVPAYMEFTITSTSKELRVVQSWS
ncbi:hypothetical protein EZV62_018686 [Acer yangbiense]|uniref:Phosphomannose isomerase type I catalytic domain-containing protein n=1 Tax=Acer yangbiense TaxID=1000413 RepID=A0A5C7HK27_9ROSI|nr:hypothetical protein EZV62_018686 [Acer yangbiense]